MEEIDERKLKERFQLEREQCAILLDGMEKLCKDLKYYHNELDCKVIDEELGERIRETTKKIIKSDLNLRNTIACISSTLGEMKEQFDTFQVDEDVELYYPTYEIRLKEEVEMMNNQDNVAFEIEDERHYVTINSILNELKESEREEDFEEIANTQLTKIPIDPFTQKEIEIPVVNRHCKHVYDKQGIMNYINQRAELRKSAKCPTIGCLNKEKLTFNDLIEDRYVNALNCFLKVLIEFSFSNSQGIKRENRKIKT